MKSLFIVVFLSSFIILLTLIVLRITFSLQFSFNCTQYLKRAADANTIELANDNLIKAIQYLEKNSFTNGIVSIFFKQPKNDIGFFYNNLLASKSELEKVSSNSTQLEKSNILIKLRETLLDHDKDGTAVTCPRGISIYPYNKLFFWMIIGSSIMLLISSKLIYDRIYPY